MTERPPQQENMELRSHLIELLRASGINSPETREAALAWREGKEREAQSPSKGREGEIGLVLETADIYMEAGLIDDAREELEDARTMAYQEAEVAQDEEAYNKFVGLFEEIESRIASLPDVGGVK